jgi:chromosome segregation ATPase
MQVVPEDREQPPAPEARPEGAGQRSEQPEPRQRPEVTAGEAEEEREEEEEEVNPFFLGRLIPWFGSMAGGSAASASSSRSARRGGTSPADAPAVFNAARRVMDDREETHRAREAELQERFAELAEAEKVFATRLHLAKRQFEKDCEEIRKDREHVAAQRREATEEADKIFERLAARDSALTEREAEINFREGDLLRAHEQLVARAMEADTREEALSRAEAVALRRERAAKEAEEGLDEAPRRCAPRLPPEA